MPENTAVLVNSRSRRLKIWARYRLEGKAQSRRPIRIPGPIMVILPVQDGGNQDEQRQPGDHDEAVDNRRNAPGPPRPRYNLKSGPTARRCCVRGALRCRRPSGCCASQRSASRRHPDPLRWSRGCVQRRAVYWWAQPAFHPTYRARKKTGRPSPVRKTRMIAPKRNEGLKRNKSLVVVNISTLPTD